MPTSDDLRRSPTVTALKQEIDVSADFAIVGARHGRDEADATDRPDLPVVLEPRGRAGARILDTAEGVLVALRRYRVDQAFVDLMQTAKRHGVNPVALADALVAIAEDQLCRDLDEAAAAVALATWGHLFGVNGRYSPPVEPLDDLPVENA